MTAVVERITEGSLLGEAPFWDIKNQALWFVDIPGQTLNKYDYRTKKHNVVSLGTNKASFIIPVKGKNNNFVIGNGTDLSVVFWDGESDEVKILQNLHSIEGPEVFNDGKCDSAGRLWIGTHVLDPTNIEATEPLGALYSFDPSKKLRTHRKKIKIGNGLEWNDQNGKFYHIDSLRHAIDQFDFDPATGNLSNEKVWFTLKNFGIPGIPDGMTIDTDGNLWVAVFGGGRVLKIDGTKPEHLLQSVEIPAQQTTSVAFGGRNLDELFVTTAGIEIKGVKPPPPDNGATYRVTGLGVKGYPPNEFKL